MSIRLNLHTLRIAFAALICLLGFSGTGEMRARAAVKEKLINRHMLEDNNAFWQMTADSMEYDRSKNLYTAEGNVVITRNGQTLSADRGIYNEETGIVQVTGHVRLTSNGDILTGEMAILDLNRYVGQITKGTLFLRENNFYIRGSAMVRTGQDKVRVVGIDGEVGDPDVCIADDGGCRRSATIRRLVDKAASREIGHARLRGVGSGGVDLCPLDGLEFPPILARVLAGEAPRRFRADIDVLRGDGRRC